MAEAILTYDAGTLLLEGEAPGRLPPQFQWDPRVGKFLAPAVARRAGVNRRAAHRRVE